MYLVLEHINKVFPAGSTAQVQAVQDMNLAIEKGEFVTLLGPSGCGKTTTLRMIAGFEFPTSGRILLDGSAINEVPPNKRDMSMVFQSYAVFPHLKVFENIAYGLRVKRLREQEVRSRVGRVMAMVKLEGLENRAPGELSGGQQQRVALARALVMEPKVLLFDEPLSNLDAKLREQMRGEIRRIQRELGITSVYVTHDQREAMTMSDRIAIMNEGVLQQVGSPTEVYQRPASTFVADFIGRANFADGVVMSASQEGCSVAVFGRTLHLPGRREGLSAGRRVVLVVRPETLTVRGGGDGFPAIVRRATYLGAVVEYDVEVAGQLLEAIDHEPHRHEILNEGQQVCVDLDTSSVHLLDGDI